MQEKTIKGVLVKKFNKWVDSIDDKDLQDLIKKNTIITGGAIVSLMQNEQPNDYDIYFKTKEVTYKVAKYYADKFNQEFGKTVYVINKSENGSVWIDDELSKEDSEKIQELLNKEIERTVPDRIKFFIKSSGVAQDPDSQKDENYYDDLTEESNLEKEIDDDQKEKEKKDIYKPVFFSSNAVSLSDKIQIVIRFYGNPEEIHENYDYAHTKAYWTSWDNNLSIPKDVYECVMNKTLRYTGSLYPVCSLFRLRKFINRGWHISAGEILKISFQISELDLTDINVLEDQLIGVDSLYFMRIIEALRKKKENDPNWEITQNYVISIIDKVF